MSDRQVIVASAQQQHRVNVIRCSSGKSEIRRWKDTTNPVCMGNRPESSDPRVGAHHCHAYLEMLHMHGNGFGFRKESEIVSVYSCTLVWHTSGSSMLINTNSFTLDCECSMKSVECVGVALTWSQVSTRPPRACRWWARGWCGHSTAHHQFLARRQS